MDVLSDAREELRAAGRSSEEPDWQSAIDSGMLDLIRAGNVEEIVPNAALERSPLAGEKFVLFRALNISARNCRLAASQGSRNCLWMPRSRSKYESLRAMLRPAVPNG